MASEDLIMQDNSMVYENDECQVSYNLWSDGGLVSFAFKNKTGKDIFINMNESFLIVNGNAHNYFEDKAYTYEYTMGYGYGEILGVNMMGRDAIWANHSYTGSVNLAKSESTKSAISESVTIKEQDIICIPAYSYKIISKFRLMPDIFLKCNKKSDYPSIKASIMSYSQDNSPIIMNNRLTYGFSNDNMDKHLDNILWLSEINNYSGKAAIEGREEKGCYDSYSKRVNYFKIGTPSQFYRVYKQKNNIQY